MDVRTAHPQPPQPSEPTAPDRLGAEVRQSALLLVLCLIVTAGVSGGAQALLALFG